MNKPAGIDIDSSDDLYVTNNGTYLRTAGFSFRLEKPNNLKLTATMSIVDITSVFRIFEKTPTSINYLFIYGSLNDNRIVLKT